MAIDSNVSRYGIAAERGSLVHDHLKRAQLPVQLSSPLANLKHVLMHDIHFGVRYMPLELSGFPDLI
jgi:hypothetical protein